jgi:hypothetical protein
MADDAELVVVRTFLTTAEADVAASALQAAGIDSMVRRDDAGGLHRELWMGGIRLLVRAEDFETANEVLSTSAEIVRSDPPKS